MDMTNAWTTDVVYGEITPDTTDVVKVHVHCSALISFRQVVERVEYNDNITNTRGCTQVSIATGYAAVLHRWKSVFGSNTTTSVFR